LLDLNKCTLPDNGGKITIANTVYYFEDWTYNYNDDGTTSYTFTINETKSGVEINPARVGREAFIGKSIQYQGIPYYQEQMNEWVRVFAQAFNDILTGGFDMDGGEGNMLFTGDVETDDLQYEFTERYNETDENGDKVPKEIYVGDDSYYRLTAKNMNVWDPMVANPDLLATKNDPTSGADEYGNITELINMTTDKKAASFRGAAVSDFLTCILSDVALNANTANTFYTTYSNVGNSINNQRLSISSVDQDEEAVSLVKYQNAYTLASKMISTLTEVYDRLILETGV